MTDEIFEEFCENGLGQITSPIEIQLGKAIAKQLRYDEFDLRIGQEVFDEEWKVIPAVSERTPVCHERIAWLAPQFPIDKYRADFLVASIESMVGHRIRDGAISPYRWELVKLPMIVVECDGHDYHERSKEQAKHDKERDRTMAVSGYRVMRFTGSEIFKGTTYLTHQR